MTLYTEKTTQCIFKLTKINNTHVGSEGKQITVHLPVNIRPSPQCKVISYW